MIISLIVAKGEQNQIGKNNSLPWKIKDDLKLFKKTTLNHTIIMGRKTFESIGRPLPHRKNIVISNDKDYKSNGVEIFNNIEDVIKFTQTEEEIFICGGAEIYKYFLDNNLANRLYISEVACNLEGDKFFPSINLNDWK